MSGTRTAKKAQTRTVQSPFAKALASRGLTVEAVRSEPEGQDKVRESSELERILRLPRRPQGQTVTGETAESLVPLLTARYRTPDGTMTLRPLQALALAELAQQRALVGRLLVGEGKTLISYLAPIVLGAKRPLLLLPGALVEKTRREFRALRQHWNGPHPDAYPIYSYEYLAHPAQGSTVDGRPDWLTRQKPDLVILDEAHRAKNPKSITTKRLKKFFAAHNVPCVVLSGTIYRKSLNDVAHLLEWALHEQSPLPRRYSDLEYWRRAVDPGVQQRIRPGSLAKLCPGEDLTGEEGLERLREGVRRRMAETPGFVSSQARGIDASLVIAPYYPDTDCSIISAAFQRLRSDWESPSGESFADGLQVARCARQLALGLYYRWSPAPPKEWRERRKEWNSWARETLKDNRRGMESEVQLIAALRAGLYNDHGLLDAWLRERDAERARTGHLQPPTEAVWVSDEGLETVAKWCDRVDSGVIWSEHTHFAHRFSALAGIPYFGAGGLCGDKPIEAHRGHCIASAPANRTGRNLQHWNTGLLLCSPEEQLLGRLHREGQTADEVRFDLLVSCKEHLTGLQNQRTVDVSSLGQQAKLAYADITVPERIEKRGARWQ